MHFPARINAHAALSTENMLRNGSLGNGGAIDYNLSVFPLFDVLAPAIPVFGLAVSWSLSFFFDRDAPYGTRQLLSWCWLLWS